MPGSDTEMSDTQFLAVANDLILLPFRRHNTHTHHSFKHFSLPRFDTSVREVDMARNVQPECPGALGC